MSFDPWSVFSSELLVGTSGTHIVALLFVWSETDGGKSTVGEWGWSVMKREGEKEKERELEKMQEGGDRCGAPLSAHLALSKLAAVACLAKGL